VSSPRPIVIGLTGPIGCGKSAALRFLVGFGADGVDADRVAHAAIQPDGPAYGPVLARFGRGILDDDGLIDRHALGRLVFSDRGALADLERLVHPAVSAEIAARIRAATAPALVIEAIKLFEAGLSQKLCDHTWVMRCTPSNQLERLWASRRMTPAEVERRQANQLTADEMAAQASLVISSDGTLAETGLKLLTAWRSLGLPLPAARIRSAEAGDDEGVAALQTTLSTPIEPASNTGGTFRWVAQLGILVVACLVLRPLSEASGVGEMRLGVAAPAQGLGVGTALLAIAKAQARKSRWSGLYTPDHPDDSRAGFYRRRGFVCGATAAKGAARLVWHAQSEEEG
jgi:dephospho-CoA kinase